MWFCRAIAILLSLGSTALAQGSIGGSQASCANAAPWVYRGCYADAFDNSATRHAGFTWQLSSTTSSTNYYPGYTGLITVSFCQLACRGHGFRFAALYYGSECYCASSFPNPQAAANTTNGPGPNPPNTNTPVADSSCNVVCAGGGASTQTCGGLTFAAVYEDPSFSQDLSFQSAGYYLYLGCYQTTSPGNLFVSIKTNSTVSCETYCGQLGYPYSARTGSNVVDSPSCSCGTEIQSGFQATADSRCAQACSGPGGIVPA